MFTSNVRWTLKIAIVTVLLVWGYVGVTQVRIDLHNTTPPTYLSLL